MPVVDVTMRAFGTLCCDGAVTVGVYARARAPPAPASENVRHRVTWNISAKQEQQCGA